MPDKCFPLFFRQFVERKLQLFQKQVANVNRLWASFRGRQQILKLQQFTTFAFDAYFPEALRLFLPEQVRDAIARHAKQPARGVLDRHQQAVRFHQLVEHVLQNVLGVERVRHASANEVAQAGSLFRDDFGNSAVLLGHRPLSCERLVHLLVKTSESRKYCGDCTGAAGSESTFMRG